MKALRFEYGPGFLEASLPDDTDVFIPGETVPDPPALEDPAAATRDSIHHPIGLPPICEQVGPGARVAIVFPDRVKGGSHPTSHRRIAIPILIDECLQAGVDERDILLVCSNGLHRKNTPAELRGLLGPEVFDRFGPRGQIVNHDSEDRENLVDLGVDELGSRVIMNRRVFEADLAIQVGHVLGNPYGGYSGGYKHCSTGITTWETISASHVPEVMHRDDFTPVRSDSLMRRKFDAIGRHMEGRMKRPFFTCDAVLDTRARQIAVFSGLAEQIQPLSWEVADRRTYIPWARKRYDVLVFGMPQDFHYGNGHGTNPILMLQAIAANVVRHRRILNQRAVVICSSLCDGYFHDEEFPSYREVFELFQKNYANTLPDIARYAEEIARRPEYVARYRWGWGYHPYHAFSMIACGHIAEMHCAAVYIVGAREPGYARAMGMKTRAGFEEALQDAMRKYVGPRPAILALPGTFKSAAVHLMLRPEVEASPAGSVY